MSLFATDGLGPSEPILMFAFAAVALVALVIAAVAVARRGDGARRPLAWAGLALALVVIGYLTLGSLVGAGPSGGQGVNLVPFQEIERGLSHRGSNPWRNLVGNVLLFVPFGLAVGALVRGGFWGRLLAATVAGGVLSTAIELTQYWGGRVADIDDIILNTAGALLGGLIAATFAAGRGRP